MNVRLAVQVLSGTMANIMKKFDTILSDECQISYTSTKWNNANIMKKVDTILSDECQISCTSTKWNNGKHHEEV